MNKRQVAGSITAILFSIVLWGCNASREWETAEALPVSESVTQEPVREPVQKSQGVTEEPKKTQIADQSSAIEEILDHAGKDFISGYLVDESFLMWLSKVYGKDSLYRLADAVREPEQDVERWHDITGKSIHVLWAEYCQHTGFQGYTLEKVYPKECADDTRVILDFTGDINLSEGWFSTEYMDRQPGGLTDCMSKSLLDEMQKADILMINNEFTYSTRGEPLAGKDFTFRADPERVSELEKLGTDVVSLANNHVYDYGEEALLDTLDTLEKAGIPYMGAGRNIADAQKPVSFLANGRKITIVSATQIERSTNYTKEAEENSPGVLKTLNPDKFISVIQQAKKKSDLVIAFVHWGTEGTNHYGSDQDALGKQFIDAGADVIIGGHTHCLQGFEYYKGIPIIYSLGNFWFNDRTLDTGISQVVFHTDDNTVEFKFLPCIQQAGVTSLVEEPEERQRILDFMQQISAPGVSVDQAGFVRENEEEENLQE